MTGRRPSGVADAVEEEVHGAEAGVASTISTPRRASLRRCLLLVLVEVRVVLAMYSWAARRKPAGAACRVADRLTGWVASLDDGRDEGPWREVLACPPLDVFGVLLSRPS